MAYMSVFDEKNVYTKDVLLDLTKFCRAHKSTFHADPRVHALLEGRREVVLRILEYLNLTEDELFSLHDITEKLKNQNSL